MRYSILFICLTLCLSCSPKKQVEEPQKPELSELLVGDWIAFWKTKPDNPLDTVNAKNYTMNGRVRIDAKGSATIKAFGFKGCVFQQDTTETLSTWTAGDRYLYLGDERNPKMNEYKIKSIAKDRVELQLLDDIDIVLYQANAHQYGLKGKK